MPEESAKNIGVEMDSLCEFTNGNASKVVVNRPRNLSGRHDDWWVLSRVPVHYSVDDLLLARRASFTHLSPLTSVSILASIAFSVTQISVSRFS
jgi:hypothetical protein